MWEIFFKKKKMKKSKKKKSEIGLNLIELKIENLKIIFCFEFSCEEELEI